jgi:hypothetical protein
MVQVDLIDEFELIGELEFPDELAEQRMVSKIGFECPFPPGSHFLYDGLRYGKGEMFTTEKNGGHRRNRETGLICYAISTPRSVLDVFKTALKD